MGDNLIMMVLSDNTIAETVINKDKAAEIVTHHPSINYFTISAPQED